MNLEFGLFSVDNKAWFKLGENTGEAITKSKDDLKNDVFDFINDGYWILLETKAIGEAAFIGGAGNIQAIIKNVDTGEIADINIQRYIIGVYFGAGVAGDTLPISGLTSLNVKNAKTTSDLIGKKSTAFGWAFVVQEERGEKQKEI